MSRLPADPVGRLAVLKAARKSIGRKRPVLNADEMAQVAGMTWRNLKLIIDRDEDFPVLARGDMGVPWQFEAVTVLNHLIAQAQAAQAARERRTATITRLSGLSGAAPVPPNGGQPAGLGSAAEMLQHVRAFAAMVDVQARIRGEKQKQGQLVDAEEVRNLLWDLMTTMQTETLAVSAKLDPAGQWEPTLRAQVDEALRNVLVTVRDRLEQKLGGLGGTRH